ncbi:ABC transporter permease subunit [Mesorhizobium sp. M5C.F.Ca.IN.020.32.2.1]|uniref:carbohydrate ABC transporter permease n=1 Tax=Mesorhizobium sp. M5C.F.Ca.IN.020.32.2.1 TaxID=2496771 RepID=UPI000FD4D954|nr:ABC transporter permease subunit [Mesorhizobium sp. M5C.F.Ca.IN.020.32.2.1]RUV28058.1 ABC transporter permease subunit [Mesorhizobium sp. M5C.F.Ca.IN.020.32.2.1]
MKKFFPIVAFIAVALISLTMAGFAYFATQEAARIKFEATADDALNRIDSRIDLHLSLLRSTHALFEARNGGISRGEFKAFFNALDIDDNFAGLRGIDGEIMKAAQIDGATTFQLYRRIVIPLLRPVFLSAFIVLAHLAIKSYDLVVALTSGGPGGSAWLPSNFMYEYTFKRNEMAVGSASAVIMLMTITAIIVPYLYSELRERPR